MEAMQLAVLGPLEVAAGGRQLDLGGPRARAVLGYLVLHPGEVVPAGQLLQALWDGVPPRTASKMVQNAVSAIRRVLAADPSGTTVLRTAGPGSYQLRTAPEDVDLHVFRRLAREGRSAIAGGAPARGAQLLTEALALWRGRALADLVENGVRWPELAAVEEERMSAVEDRLDAELACGRHREITSELEVLTATDPPRERLCRQFMVALYRSGRQADALRVYRRTRAALGPGLAPGHELRDLERRILSRDVL